MCIICLETNEENEILLECGHSYHPSCIITWFRSYSDECPTCRKKPLKTCREYENVYHRSVAIERYKYLSFLRKHKIEYFKKTHLKILDRVSKYMNKKQRDYFCLDEALRIMLAIPVKDVIVTRVKTVYVDKMVQDA